MPNITPTEHAEQVALFHWARLMSNRWPLLQTMFAVPNGGARHIAVARKLKAEGVSAGVPDIFLPVPTDKYHGLFIEMKRTKGGRVSIDQKWWIDNLRINGYRVEVCEGCAEATKVITEYLEEIA